MFRNRTAILESRQNKGGKSKSCPAMQARIVWSNSHTVQILYVCEI
jgi:hypothetical protein